MLERKKSIEEKINEIIEEYQKVGELGVEGKFFVDIDEIYVIDENGKKTENPNSAKVLRNKSEQYTGKMSNNHYIAKINGVIIGNIEIHYKIYNEQEWHYGGKKWK